MKPSVIDVPDMLTVLTVDEVEARFEEVPGVESATVNFAARKVTVRFDETLLKVADINVLVHQRGQKSALGAQEGQESGTSASPAAPAAPKPEPASAAMPAPSALTAEGQADKPVADAPPPAAG